MPMIYVLIFYYADSFHKQAVWFCSTTVALFLLKAYSGEKGKYPFGKYFFFLFYPAHFLVLYASKLVIENYGSYWLYVGLQLFCILLVLFFICRIMTEKSSRTQNAAVLFSISGLVYTVAFFIETTANTKELAFGAVTMEYLGEAGTFIGLTIFLAEFCHFRVPQLFYLLCVPCDAFSGSGGQTGQILPESK